jgi:uncharacterized protein YutE (UPF0331/DUF86 family)
METPILKIDSIRRCIARVLEISAQSPKLADQNSLDIVVLNLQRACEQSLDLANWLCAYRNLSIPRTSREVFTILENSGILPQLLAINMRKMIGFRNIAVHEYQQLDPAVVKSIVDNRLNDFEELISHISGNLEIQSGSKFENLSAIVVETQAKVIFLSIISAQIRGDDLGDDFQLEIYSKTITSIVTLSKNDDEFKPPQSSISTIFLEDNTPTVNVKFKAREVDPVADDVGEFNLTIDTTFKSEDPQTHDISIVVQGAGRGERNMKAAIDVKISISRSMGIAQISEVEPNGWVLAKNTNGQTISLPSGTAINLKSIQEGRENFEIIEGSQKGVLASVGLDKNGLTHLTSKVARTSACRMKLIRDRWVLQIAGLGDFAIKGIPASEMIYPGTYNVCLPDVPHQGGKRYRSKARHAESWFRIGDDSDRYLHPGARSKGCLTVTDISQWELIFSYVINCRLDDSHVGTLDVI